MRHHLIAILGLATLLATASLAMADTSKHATKQATHGAHAPPPAPTPAPAPAPSPAPAPAPSPPAATQPAPAAPAEPSVPPSPPAKDAAGQARIASTDIIVLHGGFVSLTPTDVDTAMVQVSAPATGPGIAAWQWALPIVGLVGVGAVVATTRGLRGDESPRGVLSRAASEPTPAAAPPRPRLNFVPADARALLEAGRAALARDDTLEALAWFTQACSIAPKISVAHYCRGVCLAELGRHEDAYAPLARAVELDSAEAAYRLELARACARTGRARESMAAIGPLLEALPQMADDVAADEAFAALADHPQFLVMTGRL